MIHFVWPWLFVLLPLPWLLRKLLPPATSTNDAALQIPFFDDFLADTSSVPDRWSLATLSMYLAIIAWVLLVLASMRPQWIGELVEIPQSGRDLMVAVDLSGSMEAQDFILKGKRVDRLTATKFIVGEFIQRRIGDRIGLILFGEQAYLQVPLTFDRKTVNELLQESFIGLAGKKTAIGNAIGLAVKRLRHQDEMSRVLVLLTDGANTAGEVDPVSAADIAALDGIKIYTVGIGADKMLVDSFFGKRQVNPSAELDEETLREIANKTGGKYFRARDIEELEEIYVLLDVLEPIEKNAYTYRPRTALYYLPLSIALGLVFIVLCLKMYR